MRIKKQAAVILLMLLTSVSLTGCLGGSGSGKRTGKGMEAIEQKEYKTALLNFQEAVEKGEDKVMAYRGAGIAYMGLSRYEEAIRAFDAALEYSDQKMPNTVNDILLYEATAQFNLGAFDDAILSCDRILEQEAVADAYFIRGASCLECGYQERAKEDFDAAVALNSQDYSLYLNIYERYEKANFSAIGDKYLQTALSIPPKEVQDYYKIGQIYYYLGQYQQAQSVLIDAVDQNYVPAMYLMGRIYLEQEDYVHARGIYESIREKDGESPENYNGLVLCSIATGNYSEALDYIAKGLSLEGEEGKQGLYFNEIVVYEEMRDFATAKVKAEQYVEKYPSDEAGQKEWMFLSNR